MDCATTALLLLTEQEQLPRQRLYSSLQDLLLLTRVKKVASRCWWPSLRMRPRLKVALMCRKAALFCLTLFLRRLILRLCIFREVGGNKEWEPQLT